VHFSFDDFVLGNLTPTNGLSDFSLSGQTSRKLTVEVILPPLSTQTLKIFVKAVT
jgi:hypothetical protein